MSRLMNSLEDMSLYNLRSMGEPSERFISRNWAIRGIRRWGTRIRVLRASERSCLAVVSDAGELERMVFMRFEWVGRR